MRKRFLLFILFAAAEVFAQSGSARLDSIFNRYASSRGVHSGLSIAAAEEDTAYSEPVKCGFPLSAELRSNYDQLSPEQKKTFSKIQEQQDLHTTLISPSGFFRIHYDTAKIGVIDNRPNYNPDLNVHENAMLAAKAFDSSYAFEVEYLGFPPPPVESLYDIYIEDLGVQYYGVTEPYKNFTSTTSYTFIRVDNDFVSTYTKGVAALNATAAHEFHHSIELGRYTSEYNINDIYFFELTATSMEEFVFDSSNDYYNYLRFYFNSPNKNFVTHEGYHLCLWNIYLQQKYGQKGYDIIKLQWDEMGKNKRAMEAIFQSLAEAGTTFQKEYAEFSVWNYFTKHRAIAGKYYEEAAAYPLIRPLLTTPTIPIPYTMKNLLPLSANYLYFDTQEELTNDTLVAIITNHDIAKGIDEWGPSTAVYTLNNYEYDGANLKVSSSFNAGEPAYWAISYIYNNMEFIPEILVDINLDAPFPNPYKYSYSSRGTEISIPIKSKKLDRANLNVYSVSGNLVYSNVKMISSYGGTFIITWNGLNNDNARLPAGIYFYAAECDGDIYKGKIAIFNE